MKKREYYTYMILLAWIQVLNYVIIVFVCSVVFFCLSTTLCSKKIAIYYLYIYTHTHDLGGGGFLRFTSPALFFLTHTQQNAYTQREGRWKLKSENRNWEIPVLFVVKMKIRHVEHAEWRIVQLWFSVCFFLFYTSAKCNKNTWFKTR